MKYDSVVVAIGNDFYRWLPDPKPGADEPFLARVRLYSATADGQPPAVATLTGWLGKCSYFKDRNALTWTTELHADVLDLTPETALARLVAAQTLPPGTEASLNNAMRYTEKALGTLLSDEPTADPAVLDHYRDHTQDDINQAFYAADEMRSAKKGLQIWIEGFKAGRQP